MKTNELKTRRSKITKKLSSYRAIELARGFSMIELLVTLTLMGIMVIIAVPLYGGFIVNSDLEATADVIVSDLRNAQVSAMSGQDGEKWGICFRNPGATPPDGDTNDRYQVYSPTTACASNGDSDAETLKSTIYLPAGITFLTPAAGAAISVVFNKITGAATLSSGSTIEISSGQGNKTITITSDGLISHD